MKKCFNRAALAAARRRHQTFHAIRKNPPVFLKPTGGDSGTMKHSEK